MIAPGHYDDSSENSTDDRGNRRALSDTFHKTPFNDDGENEQYSLVSDNNLDLDKPSSIDDEKIRLRNKSAPNIMNKCYATRNINQNNIANDDDLSQADRQQQSFMDELTDANKIMYLNKIPTHSSNLKNYLSGSGVIMDDNDGSAGIESNSSPNNNLIDEFIEDILPPPPGLPKKENSARLRRYRLE
jgi:hypothetical protein